MHGWEPFPVEDLLELLQDFDVNQLPSPKNIRSITFGAAKAEFLTMPFMTLMKIRHNVESGVLKSCSLERLPVILLPSDEFH